MLGQRQQQSQQQRLSPQQIQMMKLLQLPTTEIEQRIIDELEGNPVLEAGDEYEEEPLFNETDPITEGGDDEEFGETEDTDFKEIEEVPLRDDDVELDDYLARYTEDESNDYIPKGEGRNADEEDKTVPIAMESSFHEYLEQQIGTLNLKTDRELAIAKQIIGSIDDDGYLRHELEAIADDLLISQNLVTNVREIADILEIIQRFDPPGVGARDLRECLLIQIKVKLETEEMDAEREKNLKMAARLIFDMFDQFTKKHYTKMQKQLNLTEEELKAPMNEILKLNPRPATGHVNISERNMQYIVPDFTIENRDGRLELVVDSRNVPDLRVSEHFREMLKSYKNSRSADKRINQTKKDAVMFIKQKIDSAKWFIDAIRQRELTMYKTMYAILDYQREFFMTGDEKVIRPMILKDIADATELDISTISRVANSKYVQTEFGTKRLKDFFSESLQTSEGEEVSTLEVKKILTDIISVESKKKPLSDEKLKSMLTDKGYNIARRTVAKYREQLNIPVARLRKAL